MRSVVAWQRAVTDRAPADPSRRIGPGEALPPMLPEMQSTERSAPSQDNSRGPPVVGIGASAGGLEALSLLLRALPADTGMAFVLVQHLASTRESMLADILAKLTSMPVAEATDKLPVAPDHVYVIPPGCDMTIAGGVLQLLRREVGHMLHRPIDRFLRSLAEDQGVRSIGVILSGTANDGTHGMEEIKAAGGITFAQDDTAQQHGMPRSAVAAGCVDLVLAPDAIAAEITRIARHPRPGLATAAPAEASEAEAGLLSILEILRVTTGVDFSRYKAQTLHRRIKRRMTLHRLDDLQAYARLLTYQAAELQALYQDILISVTGFFRDPEVFEALQTTMFPELFAQHTAGAPIRVWVVGCSSGEEAYSFAIALVETAERTGSEQTFQVFATDLSDVGIEKARAGSYSKSVTHDLSPERLRRFFTEEGGRHRINADIRDMCVFSRRNVLTDPPFSHIDVLSCRNMLIYLEPVLQEKLMPLLHYAMDPDGLLVLGSSETAGLHSELFETRDAEHRIYARRPPTAGAPVLPTRTMPVAATLPARPVAASAAGASPAIASAGTDDIGVQAEVDRLLLGRYSPAGVVVNAELEILTFRGDTSPYLVPAAGRASFQLLKMARDGLPLALRAAIREAKQDGVAVRKQRAPFRWNGGDHEVSLEIVPLTSGEANAGRMLVLFTELASIAAPAAAQAAPRSSFMTLLHATFGSGRNVASDGDVPGQAPGVPSAETQSHRLARELTTTREHLQAVIEQQDDVNAKLLTANERAQAANEELQTFNEELATSQEEIQASNEELATVNDELNDRNLDVSRINNDLVNLIGGVQMPIAMLDSELRIRRFSPLASTVLRLSTADVGRPIHDVHLAIDIPGLDGVLRDVIRTGSPRETEVQDGKGRWFSLRVRPYRTPEDRIDGIVLMLFDVDRIKRARAFAENVVATLREPLLVLDAGFRVRMASRAFYTTFRMVPEQTENRLLHELADRQWDIPELRRLLEVVLPQQTFFDGFEVTRDFKDIGRKTMLLNARQLIPGGDEPSMILLAIEDFTRHKQLEDDLHARLEDLARVDRSRTEFLAMLAHELRNPLAAISSGLVLLSNSAATQEQQQHARDVTGRQLRIMVRLTDDLLDASRVARGRIQLKRERIELVGLLQQAVEECGHALALHGRTLTTDFPSRPVPVDGDVTRLKQVFINLIQNAVRYGMPSGHVWVSIEPAGHKGAPIVVIRVRDDGIGIDAATVPTVFDLFSQADNSLARSQGGLGIGLTLVRSLVELHGGTVEARSAGIGKGSEFEVRLPMLIEEAENPAASPAAHGQRILIVDDNVDAADSMAMVLRLAGHEVITAHGGKAALESQAAFRPAIVLLDIGLPGIDGYEVARRLRRLPGGESLFIIAVSGYGNEDDRRRSREAGFDRHLIKPVDDATLQAMVRNVRAHAAAQRARAAPDAGMSRDSRSGPGELPEGAEP